MPASFSAPDIRANLFRVTRIDRHRFLRFVWCPASIK